MPFFSEQFYTIFEIDKTALLISPFKSRLINSDDIKLFEDEFGRKKNNSEVKFNIA
jgi:hypothetical protein